MEHVEPPAEGGPVGEGSEDLVGDRVLRRDPGLCLCGAVVFEPPERIFDRDAKVGVCLLAGAAVRVPGRLREGDSGVGGEDESNEGAHGWDCSIATGATLTIRGAMV